MKSLLLTIVNWYTWLMSINVTTILTLLSGLAFLSYGILCLTTNHMVEEFVRYGLLKYRYLTGVLEVLGGLGSLVGLYYRPIMMISTGGLTILMLLGVIVRLRIKDPYLFIIPAFVLMLINAYLFFKQFS